jgi:hypothetical protein
MPTYNTRTATGQGVFQITMATRLILPENSVVDAFNVAIGGSTYQNNIVSGVPVQAIGNPVGARITNAEIFQVDIDSIHITSDANVSFGYGVFGDIIVSQCDSSVVNNTFFTKAIMPPGNGSVVETEAYVFYNWFLSWIIPGNVGTLEPILESGGDLRGVAFADGSVGGALSGHMLLMKPSDLSLTDELKWEGFDTPFGINHSFTTRPFNDLSGNWIMHSGSTRPILVSALLNGTENGRYNIHLDDPTWDAVLVSSGGVKTIRACDAGWFAAISITHVTPATFFLFNEDCTQYWVYNLVGTDQNSIDSLTNTIWGKDGNERIFIAAPLVGNGSPGDLTIFGAGSDRAHQASVITNGAPIPSRILLPPFPAVYMPPCVPCAPMQLIGDQWVGRLA